MVNVLLANSLVDNVQKAQYIPAQSVFLATTSTTIDAFKIVPQVTMKIHSHQPVGLAAKTA